MRGKKTRKSFASGSFEASRKKKEHPPAAFPEKPRSQQKKLLTAKVTCQFFIFKTNKKMFFSSRWANDIGHLLLANFGSFFIWTNIGARLHGFPR